jgi:hypothetical protein
VTCNCLGAGLAGNDLFPATSRVVVPAATGDRVTGSAGRADAFPAMSAGRPPDRGLRPARDRPPTLREAADAFLAQPDLAASSSRSYAQTLGRLQRDLGPERPLEWVYGREFDRAVVEAWGGCAPATWNRQAATVRSFSAFCVRRGWVGEPFAEALARRREPADRTRAIPYAQLERLWRRDDGVVREKALWRLS